MFWKKNTLDKLKIKEDNEKYILKIGGQVCSGLPCFDSIAPRPVDEIIERFFAMYHLINIGVGGKVSSVKDTFEKNNLLQYLSCKEREILYAGDDKLNERNKINLYWYIESTWALMWVLSFTKDLDVFKPADTNYMANIFSRNLKANIRFSPDIYKMLDLYYRLHWLCVDVSLKAGNSPLIPDIRLPNEKTIYGSVILERRKALTWVMHPDMDWDHVDMNT